MKDTKISSRIKYPRNIKTKHKTVQIKHPRRLKYIKTNKIKCTRDTKIHETVYWDGGGGTHLSKPTISVTAFS